VHLLEIRSGAPLHCTALHNTALHRFTLFCTAGPGGSLQTQDSLCVLPVNIINEKIYVFLWFWLVALLVATALSTLHSLLLLAMPSFRWPGGASISTDVAPCQEHAAEE
jgi:hypothetical protein